MFALRLVALGFMVAWSVALGSVPARDLSPLGKLIGYSAFLWVPLLYMLPTIEARLRSHPNLPSLGALNFFLGWTVIGWVGSLVWALKKSDPVHVVESEHRSGEREPSSSTQPQQRASTADELQRLASLLDRGLLTEEEFKAEKAKILART